MQKRSFLNLDPSNQTIHFKTLPVWNGVNTKAKSLVLAPFALSFNSDSQYVQNTTQEELNQLIDYGHENYQHGTPTPSTAAMQRNRAMSFLGHIERLCGGVKGKSILEIGAGSTFIGDYFTESAGAESYVAVDPSITAIPASKKSRVIRQFFDVATIDEKFDIVFSIATLEHAFDTHAYLAKARNLLAKSDSHVVTIVPDIEPEFQSGDFNAFSHEHVQYFYAQTLWQAHVASGLHVTQQYAEKRALYLSATRDETPSSKPMPKFNPLPNIETVATTFIKSAEYINELLHRLKERKPAFYGATGGLNNLIHLLDIRDPELQVFDSDPLKTGKYLPACDAVVRSGQDCLPSEFDAVIISAMQFYAEIRSFLIEKQGFRAEQIFPVTPSK